MASASGARRAAAITGINVTPLVDVTLVLLIIFMVTARLITQRQTLPVDLPKAATGAEVQDLLGVVIARDGRIELNGARITTDAELLTRVHATRRATPDVRAVIKADAGVSHGQVMHVLDLLRQASVAKVGFGVIPSTPARED
jgi:biopolymer transport protein ExbD